jgi:hypothetical protein
MSDDEYFDGEYCERCENVFDEGEIAFYEDDEGGGIWCCDDCLDLFQQEGVGEMSSDKLTESDWLQIEMAAAGCIDGTSDQWPSLRAAIEKITGRPFGPRKTANWMQGFCEGVMIQSGRDRK